MSQSTDADFDLPELPAVTVRAAGEDRQGVRIGLALTGACLGAAVALLAVASAGITSDNPIGWLAIGCAAVIGAVLGA